MFCIGICQNHPDFLARVISAALTESGFPVFFCEGKAIEVPKDNADTVAIIVSSEPYDSNVRFDLCVYEPNFHRSISELNTTLAIIPDSCKPQQFQNADNVITYGLCSKNTVTVSSLIAHDLVISVQREIPTLTGHPVDAQEFHVTLPQIDDVDDALAVVSTLLALGVPPEKITEITKE